MLQSLLNQAAQAVQQALAELWQLALEAVLLALPDPAAVAFCLAGLSVGFCFVVDVVKRILE